MNPTRKRRLLLVVALLAAAAIAGVLVTLALQENLTYLHTPSEVRNGAAPADAAYVKGVVAMAKTQTEPPGTSGSQFFVVTGDDVGLPPEYAVVGKVTSGMAVVPRIAKFGDVNDPSGTPTRPIVVESITVEEQ